MYSRLMKETWVLKRTILKQSPFLHISKFKTKLPQYINQQIALIAFQNDTNLRSINRTFSIKPRKFILKNMFKNIFVRNCKLYNSDKFPIQKIYVKINSSQDKSKSIESEGLLWKQFDSQTSNKWSSRRMFVTISNW